MMVPALGRLLGTTNLNYILYVICCVFGEHLLFSATPITWNQRDASQQNGAAFVVGGGQRVPKKRTLNFDDSHVHASKVSRQDDNNDSDANGMTSLLGPPPSDKYLVSRTVVKACMGSCRYMYMYICFVRIYRWLSGDVDWWRWCLLVIYSTGSLLDLPILLV